MLKSVLKLILITFLFISLSYSQDSTQSSVKWGLGISSSILSASTYQYYTPELQNKAISFPIFISSTFKLEPFISIYDNKYESESDPSGITLNEIKNRHITFGIGVFYTSLIKKTRLHFGGKIGYVKSKYTYYYNRTGFINESESTGKGYLVSPTVGGEYFFSNHFSLGGEANFEWSSLDSDDKDKHDSTEDKSSTNNRRFNTLGVIHIRIYFN